MGALASIAACLLLGQTAPSQGGNAPATASNRPAATARATESTSESATPPVTTSSDDWSTAIAEATALTSELFQPIASTDASVRGVKLADAVASARGPREQTAAVQAYWQLAAAAARSSVTQREIESLQLVADIAGKRPDAKAASALAAAISKASRERDEADSELVRARREIATRLNLDARTTPVAIDVPHAGTYHTRFSNIYTGAAPPQAVVLHRTIQLRTQNVFALATAARATSRLAEADLVAFEQGQTPWHVALASVVDQGRRRRAFIEAVYSYNRDIAEYALPIANANASTATLVGMLIKLEGASTARQPGTPKSASRPGAESAGDAPTSTVGARR